ncbi:MAG TPA: rhomboid family intramembrane serine protease [Nitrospirota bacterium]|nr:rhomboid family intramembrane serine protease [Nitrospirota bacterium]
MFPIKDTVPRRTFPLATLLIIVANGIVFFFELSMSERYQNAFIELFGLVPARYTHPLWATVMGFPLDSYWPFLTNMFIHGGWLHFIANMWTLFLFGDNVEDRLGRLRFLLFYLAAGIAANLIHFFVFHDSTMPVIGASGAIAGVMAAYLRLFPRARIITLIPVLFFPFFFDVPAVLFMAIWFFTQLLSGAASLAITESAGGIAWWAHIGGFALGFLFIKPLCKSRSDACNPGEDFRSV